MQVRAMRGRTDFDVRFVFWLIPLWINFRSLLFTCWLILPLIFWPPSFSRTGNESQKNTCNLSLKFGVFCNTLAGGLVPHCRKKCMKNSNPLPRSVLNSCLQNDILRWKNFLKKQFRATITMTMEIDIGIAYRLGHGIFFVWHAVKYVVGQTNVSAFTQIMF